jgi:N-acetylmuramoyl-L-alanine amidase
MEPKTSPRPVISKHSSILTPVMLLLIFAAAPMQAQQSKPMPTPQVQAPVSAPTTPKPAPAFYRNLVVLDPAHGGRDSGAQISGTTAEKDVTLAFAQKLRPALVAQGFTVVATRDSDPTDELASDVRAGIANHDRPLVCLLLHATGSGTGVHLVYSSLPQAKEKSSTRTLPWDRAQEPMIAMSTRLANELGVALENAHVPVLLLQGSVPPIDNLICPAVAVELSPLKSDSSKTIPVTDGAYQQRVIDAVAAAIASFRTHNAPAPTQSNAGRAGGSQ